jgi:hypothetical protein
MFGVVNAVLRAFVVGVVVGMLFAPRPGAETRRMLNERLTALLNQVMEIAALPPVEPAQARTDGSPERPAAKRTRSSSEGSSARSSST